jgi:hypothetical protein
MTESVKWLLIEKTEQVRAGTHAALQDRENALFERQSWSLSCLTLYLLHGQSETRAFFR